MRLAALVAMSALALTAQVVDLPSYSYYAPSNYQSDRPWPILYCLDPGARGRLAAQRFAKAAEAEGFLVAASNKSRNGPIEPVREAIAEMVEDTHRRWNIDEKRIYAAGFSGGARVALSWAMGSRLAGVVACGAGFGLPAAPKEIRFAVYGTAGVDDFNHDEMVEMSLDLAKHHQAHRFIVFEGGHEWLPEPLALEALRYFNGKVPQQAAVDSKEEHKQAARLRELSEALQGPGKDALAAKLKQQAADERDSGERRVARRALGLARVRGLEPGR